MFGLLTTAGVEVENVSAYDDPKQSYVFSLEKAVGESTLSAGFKVNRGRGNDTASQEDATATLSVKMPLYEGTSFHVDGKYAGAKDNAASAYRNGSLLAGVTVTF